MLSNATHLYITLKPDARPRKPPLTHVSSAYRPDLQGLRAIAIGLVVLAHAGLPLFAGGYIGVDVFFVLSGFLITRLLDTDLQETGHIRIARFYARRLQRLLPALMVMLVSAGLAAHWLLSQREALAVTGSMPFAMVWLSNWYFTFLTTGYFDELSSKDLFLHTWSLGVEEQFYLIWPVVFGLLAKYTGKKRAVALSAVLLASFTLCLYWTFTHPHSAFYLMPSRIWELGLGGLVYLLLSDQPGRGWLRSPIIPAAPARVLLYVGVLLISTAAITLPAHLAYPGAWALLPSVGAALIIAGGQCLPAGSVNPLGHRSLIWLGDRSYSLYLWHWPVLVLGFSYGLRGQPAETLALILLALLLSIVSYRLIEHPFWKGRLSDGQPRMIVLVSLLVILTGLLLQAQTTKELTLQGHSETAATTQPLDAPVIYSMPCDSWYFSASVEPCVFTGEAPSRTAVLLGDSIGVQWFSAIQAVFSGADWRLIVFTKSSCPMVDEDYFYPRIGKVNAVCSQWRAAVLDEILNIKPDVVVVGTAASYDFRDDQWRDGSRRVLQHLARAAKQVLVIPATPVLGFDGPGCLARYPAPAEAAKARAACTATGAVQAVQPLHHNLQQAANNLPNVHVTDFTDLVCPLGNCSAVSDRGVVVYRDSQHLTDSFVRSVTTDIHARLHALLTPAGIQIAAGPVLLPREAPAIPSARH